MSTSGATKKRKVRGGHRAYTTKAVGNARAILETFEPSKVLALKQHRAILEEKLNTLRDLDDQILDLLEEEEEIGVEINEAGEFRENVHKILIEIDEKLRSLAITTVTTTNNQDDTNPTPHGGAACFTKLPKLQLRKFYGEPHKWQEFWDSFKAAVDNNTKLTDALKLEYLKSQCEKTAYHAIAGLELIDGNYKIATDILKNRFGQRQVILNSHIDALLKINPVNRNTDITEIRKFYDTVETHSRGLQALGVDQAAYGTVLVNVLLQKLPEEIQLIISRKMSELTDNDKDWELPVMLEILKGEIEAREKCVRVKRELNKTNTDKFATAATLTTGSENKPKPKCTFCSGNHSTANCNVVTNMQERRNILRKSGRCFLCLRKAGHLAKDCDASIKCFGCRGNHHVALCQKRHSGNFRQENKSEEPSDIKKNTPDTFCGINTDRETGKGVLLQTAFVKAQNPENPTKMVNLRIILDSGSQRSYISEKARNALQLPTVEQEDIIIKVFGSDESKANTCDIVSTNLLSRQSKFETRINALVVPTICSPLQGQTVRFAKGKYAHLHSLNLADYPKETETELAVDILIGSDYLWRILSGEIVRSESEEEAPIAVGTGFGWVLSGTVGNIPRNLLSAVNLSATHVLRVEAQCQPNICDEDKFLSNPYDTTLHEKVTEHFELENLGIKEFDSMEEEFSNNIKFEEGHYSVKLPFREYHEVLTDNYDLSVARLKSTLKRLRKNPKLLEEYDNVIRQQIESGIVEEVKPNLVEPLKVGRVHYLSHHAVIREEAATTKVRVVMDGSMKCSADTPSLNECLHTGPSLNPNIFDILLRFRAHKIGLIADVEKAFHMIGVDEKDRDVLRFLWINDINSAQPEIITLRFTRVVFGLNCSPFLLGATLKHHISNYSFEKPEIAVKLSQSFYVDDLVSGGENKQEVCDLYQQSNQCLKDGGFNLRKWKSNEQNLEFGEPEQKLTKVLGTVWNLESDELVLDFENFVKLSKDLLPTKRNLLKLSASLFDPLGFVSPSSVKMKMMLQDCCKLNLEWDKPLPESLNVAWKEIVEDLDDVCQLSIQRCYFNCKDKNIYEHHLHGFCDASEKGYCAVVYIVYRIEDGYECSIVTSKSRVTPLKKLTIPRLELLAALILSRLMNTVKSALKDQISFDSVWYWSDSTIVLSWIKNNRNYKQFVSHRIKEILALSSPDNWNYCPTDFNPADIGSRGHLLSALNENSLWWFGPDWIKGSQENFPKQPSNKELEPEQCLEEMRKETATLFVELRQDPAVNLDKIMEVERYSSLTKLLRVTAYVIRFVSRVKSKARKVTDDHEQEEHLAASEIDEAEKLWIKTAQALLSEEKHFAQLERELGLFTDDCGVIRCRGRIGNSRLKYETKFPALLPSNHYLTTLVILNAHEKVFHHGEKSTLNEVRSKFWITRARQKIRKIVHKCTICKRFESQSYSYPAPPHLPDFRVDGTHAFESVGTDLAGPLYVRYLAKDTTYHKVWIVIFTCTLSRAVHLELMVDMSAEQFLLALRRFLARRGIPNLLISDNAKTFKKAATSLNKLFKNVEVKRFLAKNRIQWLFNLSKAPWYGSIYERLIKTVKRCLKKTLRNAKVTMDELYTILVEIEGVLNSRPLTYQSTEEFDQPLTPSHLIFGRKLESLPHEKAENCSEENITRNLIVNRQQYIGQLLIHWWQRWKNEYLVDLRETHKLLRENRRQPEISVGDIVTVHEDNKKPRGFWRLGKVEKLIESKDNEIRGATVKVVTPKGHVSLINRPVKKLFPVEVMDNKFGDLTDNHAHDQGETNQEAVQRVRPRRQAALNADILRRIRDNL